MSDLKRRPLHSESPRPLSQLEEEVTQNNTFVLDGANSYEEGTSSAGEQEHDEEYSETLEEPEADNLSTSIPPTVTQKLGGNGLYFSLAFIVCLSCLIFFQVWGTTFSNDSEKKCAFSDIRELTPKQPEKVWKALQKGVEGLINKRDQHPSVFLFLYQDPKLQNLIDAIASETSMCFGGPRQLIHMRKDDFGSDTTDHGLAIERFKEKVNDGKVFLIVNLNEIAPSGARALHTICDTYSPIVEDVVIFLTLRTFNTTAVRNSVQLATDTLYDLWDTELGDNELDPLITRVTDQVLYLSSTT
ncbi:uncharacterized protein LOC108107974 [Drosophila eugracilis]|uniref:uncharacterized protein LOC108107974 n=1 Tax=Drosophila eugracilis TaxID=29029 RepID=UPI0007E5E0E9|nr:uncharacterized protein LOC108107974 [Drosophila eugracilis]